MEHPWNCPPQIFLAAGTRSWPGQPTTTVSPTASTAVSFFIERSEDSSLPVPAQLAAQAVSATEIQLTWLPLPTNTPDASVLVEK